MSRLRPVCVGLVLLALPAVARTDIRQPLRDTELIGCDLVVVARIKPDSLQQTDRDTDVKLIIAQTLRGGTSGEVIDVRIHPMVVVAGYCKRDGRMVEYCRGGQKYPKTHIMIADGQLGDLKPALDLSKDAIWFLRKSQDESRHVLRRGEYVQPASLKPLFSAMLSARPSKAVLTVLGHKNKDVRLRTLAHLAELHRPQDAPPIARLLDDEDGAVRLAAAKAAAEVGDVDAIGIFRKALGHADPQVRAVACTFLCRFRDTASIAAIGRALEKMPAENRYDAVRHLWRMNSPDVVDILLGMLSERLDPKRANASAAYHVSSNAVESLRRLTGVHFPLDSASGRLLWRKFKPLDPEVLLRRTILAAIEDLTYPDYDVRWSAYRQLHRLVNQHFGSYNAFHGHEDAAGRLASQKQWRQWADGNLTSSRRSWVYEGFRDAGVELPDPMTPEGVATLMEVITFYRNGEKHSGQKRAWKRLGWSQADYFVYNANRLLEQCTGHTVGLSPYHHDLERSYYQPCVLANRWFAWWESHRDKIKLRPLPGARTVKQGELDKAPVLKRATAPIELKIRPSKKTYAMSDQVVIHVQVKNISAIPITLARRPQNIQYTSKTSSGSGCWSEKIGTKQADYITLKPGHILEWAEKNAAFSGQPKPYNRVELFHYRLTWPYGGSQFGLKAWRGEIRSNDVDYTFTDQPK